MSFDAVLNVLLGVWQLQEKVRVGAIMSQRRGDGTGEGLERMWRCGGNSLAGVVLIASPILHCGVAFDRWLGALVASVSLLMVSRA